MRAIAVAAFAAAVAFAQSTPAVKKRIAIFDFENAAASGAVSSTLFSTTGPNTGNAVANLLINRLVQNANATIIERAAIDKLIAAQNLSNSDRTDPLTAAKLGPILGVDAIILGAITQNDFEDKVRNGMVFSYLRRKDSVSRCAAIPSMAVTRFVPKLSPPDRLFFWPG